MNESSKSDAINNRARLLREGAVVFRRFCRDDAEACRTLILRCVGDMTGISAGGHEALSKRIAESSYLDTLSTMYCVVAEEAKMLLAMGALDGEYIKRMYVSPERRGEGLGKKIYNLLEREAHRRGLSCLELDSSLNAVGFYQALGFVKVREHTWSLDQAKVTNINMHKVL